jgi:hypothetical protein
MTANSAFLSSSAYHTICKMLMLVAGVAGVAFFEDASV